MAYGDGRGRARLIGIVIKRGRMRIVSRSVGDAAIVISVGPGAD
jgi:hypothetical protein